MRDLPCRTLRSLRRNRSIGQDSDPGALAPGRRALPSVRLLYITVNVPVLNEPRRDSGDRAPRNTEGTPSLVPPSVRPRNERRKTGITKGQREKRKRGIPRGPTPPFRVSRLARLLQARTNDSCAFKRSMIHLLAPRAPRRAPIPPTHLLSSPCSIGTRLGISRT